jgi:iron complex outermembrane receptor protein
MKMTFASASTLALIAACAAPSFALAQQEANVDAIIVTGTRTTGLRAVDSPAPVQVLGADVLKRTGQPDLIQALAQNVPSFTAQAFGSDAAAFNLSIKLRGISPNHTLVLINGKRRHGTANVAVSGGPYGGGASADMALIPVASIDHVEVLLDGAAAQYGTDAIAGVVNIIQKKNTSGGTISASGGRYFDGGGLQGDFSANLGIAPTDKMYLNLTGETRYHGFSFRGDRDPRVINTGFAGNVSAALLTKFPGLVNAKDYPYVNRIAGDAQSRSTIVTYNAGYELTPDINLYSFGTYGYKWGQAYENYRVPTAITGVAATDIPFPLGFSPKESITENDYALTGGIEGVTAGWNWDLSTTYGKDHADVNVLASVNGSLYKNSSTATTKGESPRTFHDGDFFASQWTTTFDVTHEFNVGLAGPLNVASGVEYRKEMYEIRAGDPTSYYGTGAQSFFGYAPVSASHNTRTDKSIYLDLSVKPIDQLLIDGAVRYEKYSDFGDTTVGKLTARYDLNDMFAARATISTGFRAPTLGEGFYSGINVGPTSISGVFAPNSAGAKFLGASGLGPEKSKNYSVGFVTHFMPGLTMTLDGYKIKLTDRIVQTGNFFGYNSNKAVVQSPSVLAALAGSGVTIDPQIFTAASGSVGVVMFVNGLDTTTKGLDYVATYSTDIGAYGRIDWSLTANYNKTKINRVAPPPSNVDPRVLLLDAQAQASLTKTTPEYRGTVGANWTYGKFGVNLKETLIGPSYNLAQDPLGAAILKNRIAKAGITDLEVSYMPIESVKVSLGANNLFNEYPNFTNGTVRYGSYATNASGYASNKYPSFSPFGINGGYYYGKVSYTF